MKNSAGKLRVTDPIGFGYRLRSLRESCGQSPAEFGERFSRHPCSMMRYEEGNVDTVSESFVVHVAEEFGITVDSLLHGGGDWEPKEIECIYNRGVYCKSHNKCQQCGWNPAVEKRRKEQVGAVETERLLREYWLYDC